MKIKKKKNGNTTEYWGNVTDILQDIMGQNVKSAYMLLVEDYTDLTTKTELKTMCDNTIENYKKTGKLQCDSTKVIITVLFCLWQDGEILNYVMFEQICRFLVPVGIFSLFLLERHSIVR